MPKSKSPAGSRGHNAKNFQNVNRKSEPCVFPSNSSIEAVNLSSAQALAVQLLKDGYLKARVLPDGSVAALLQLIYTRAICLGCDRQGWNRRFCFRDPELAESQFLALQGEDDTPSGFIAQR